MSDPSGNGTAPTFRADNVRAALDSIRAHDWHADGVPETLEEFAKEVVESGTFTPDCQVSIGVSLNPKDRITGYREQDVTVFLTFGMVLGTALERDVPMDTALEDAWEDGAFELPTHPDLSRGDSE